MTPSLARIVFGASFQNPLMLAAGTAGFGVELDGVIRLERLGGMVTKAVSLQPRAGNAPPRVAEFQGGMINSVGLANPGLDAVRRDKLPWLATHIRQAQVLVNVVGFAEAEYAEVVAGLDGSEGFLGYELNLSCPNTAAGGIEFGADPAAVARIVAACRARTRRPLVVKISPALPDIVGIALAARDAGADGVSLVNTMPGYLYRGDRRTPRVGNGNGGVSGPALLPVGILATRRVAERTGGEFPIIGVGGVSGAADVRQYLAAGAHLVAMGTACLADPRQPERIVTELETEHG